MQQRLCQHFQTGAIEALTVAAPRRGAGEHAVVRHLATARVRRSPLLSRALRL